MRRSIIPRYLTIYAVIYILSWCICCHLCWNIYILSMKHCCLVTCWKFLLYELFSNLSWCVKILKICSVNMLKIYHVNMLEICFVKMLVIGSVNMLKIWFVKMLVIGSVNMLEIGSVSVTAMWTSPYCFSCCRVNKYVPFQLLPCEQISAGLYIYTDCRSLSHHPHWNGSSKVTATTRAGN
jgi:hypothetical protein